MSGVDRQEPYLLFEPADYEEYLARIDSGKATAQEQDEFMMRAIEHFCAEVYAGNQPKPWVLQYIADNFSKILAGGRWEDEFPLPWTNVEMPGTRAQRKGLNIYCDIENAAREDPNADITKIIRRVAENHHVSYESARAHYYVRRDLSKK